jgi:hypothetical protein
LRLIENKKIMCPLAQDGKDPRQPNSPTLK